ncbi:thioredoxin family protein [Paraurantiacibacter namhicola]|uniref:Thioredoxin domain-containing protein n=1 Tax=Paraurantiacibacter namhicola TaxID=645517 RepID=A0A1C7DBL1_9SPHN|nr:thioredoxin family protein [Paraurantiacibacter namhicola]ANU08807.1 hypothetical protein A6F65_02529 [Paraurantiacibacter namhicola]
MRRLAALGLLLSFPLLPGCATASHHAELPDAAPYDQDVAEAQAAADLDARVAALEPGRSVLAVFGADWCHDSRALAGWLEMPRFQQLIADEFDVVYIDVGTPQDGRGRNLDLAARYGVADIEGTPSVLVIGPGGRLLNTPQDARAWRNAASRSEDAIFAALEDYAARD